MGSNPTLSFVEYECPYTKHQEEPERERLVFWLDRLSKQLEDAMKDEEEARRIYERLRVDMAAVFPPGTIPYDIIMSIGEDEQSHYEKLRDVRDIIVEGLKKAIKIV